MWSLDCGLIFVVPSALMMVVVDGKAKPEARLSAGA
jgi:hypothetical protein